MLVCHSIATFAIRWVGLAAAWSLCLAVVQGQEQEPNAAPAKPLPSGALQRFGSTQFRHGNPIQALALSPDGRILAAGGGNDPVRLWDSSTGQELRRLKDTWVQALAFSPDGKLLATGSGFHTITLWNPATGAKVGQLKGHTGAIRALAFTPAGNALLSAAQDGSVRLWNTAAQQAATVLTGHPAGAACVAIAPDGKTAVSGGYDHALRFWNLPDGKAGRVCDGGCNVTAVAFTPDGKTVLSAGDDGRIRVWDAEQGTEQKSWPAHKGAVSALRLSADGKLLVSGGPDQVFRIWDWPSGKKLRETTAHPGDTEAVALSADGRLLAGAGQNQLIRRWQTEDAKEMPLAGFAGAIQTVTTSPDGRWLAISAGIGTVAVHDAKGRQRLAHWTVKGSDPRLVFSPDGRWLTTATTADGVRLWNTESWQEALAIPVPSKDQVLALAFAPNSKQLAISFRNGGLHIFDPATGKDIQTVPKTGGLQALAFSTNGKHLAGANPERILLWDTQKWETAQHIDTEQPVTCLAFSPNGALLASGHFDAFIRLWDMTTGKQVRECEGHRSAIYALAFSPTGRLLISGSFDRSVRTWEVVSGGAVNTWTGHLGPVQTVAAATDGRRVYSGSTDTTVLVWDVPGYGPTGTPPADSYPASRLEELWQQLAAEEAAKGYQSLWTLMAGGKDTVGFLNKRVFLVDRNEVETQLKHLNSNKFTVREKATIALSGYGQWIKGRLAEAAKTPPSLEVKLRLEALLARLNNSDAISLERERYRLHRVMEILEQLGTPQARQLLVNLTRGAVETTIAEEAQAALDRLDRK